MDHSEAPRTLIRFHWLTNCLYPFGGVGSFLLLSFAVAKDNNKKSHGYNEGFLVSKLATVNLDTKLHSAYGTMFSVGAKRRITKCVFLYDYTVIGESNFTESSFDVPSSFMVTP